MLNETFSQNPPAEVTPAMIESCIQSVMKNVVDTPQVVPVLTLEQGITV
jgi:hypothetical protein